MAEQRGKFIRGVIGGYIFRVVNNKQRVSAKPLPGTMKQTKDTKRASNTFGMASSLGAQMRRSVSTEIAPFNDGFFTNQLTSGLIQILNEARDSSTKLYQFDELSFSKLSTLEYNRHSKVKALMTIRPQVSIADGTLKVEIPKLSIPKQLKFPGDTYQCKLSIYLSLFRLRDGKSAKIPDKQEVVVTREKNLLSAQELTFEVPDGCLCLVSLFMEYSIGGKNGWEPINNEKFNPGCICAALITPGVYQDKKRRTWLKTVPFDM